MLDEFRPQEFNDLRNRLPPSPLRDREAREELRQRIRAFNKVAVANILKKQHERFGGRLRSALWIPLRLSRHIQGRSLKPTFLVLLPLRFWKA